MTRQPTALETPKAEAKDLTMIPLDARDIAHLQAAHGWLDLDNTQEADAEYLSISPLGKLHPRVVFVRLRLFEAKGLWEWAYYSAKLLARLNPADSQFPIRRAQALRYWKGPRAAYDGWKPPRRSATATPGPPPKASGPAPACAAATVRRNPIKPRSASSLSLRHFRCTARYDGVARDVD